MAIGKFIKEYSILRKQLPAPNFNYVKTFASGAAIAVDWSQGAIWNGLLTSASTFTFTPPTTFTGTGSFLKLILTQTGVGGFAVTFPASVIGSPVVNLAVGAVTTINLTYNKDTNQYLAYTETGGSIPNMTAGSVLFAGANGVVSQDNPNLFYDDTNNRLGVGTNAPLKGIETATGLLVNPTQLAGSAWDFSLAATAIAQAVTPTNISTALVTAPETAMRLIRGGLNAIKYNASVDFMVGTWQATINSAANLRIMMGDGASNTPDATAMTIQSNGNMGLGTNTSALAPTSPLVIEQSPRSGTHSSTAVGFNITGDIPSVANTNVTEPTAPRIVHTNGTQGVIFGYDGISNINNAVAFALKAINGAWRFWPGNTVSNANVAYTSGRAATAGDGTQHTNWAGAYTRQISSIDHTMPIITAGSVLTRIDFQQARADGGMSSSMSLQGSAVTANGLAGVPVAAMIGELNLQSAVQNRRIVLWDGGNVTSEHSFFGLGINDYTLRYQVNSTASRHMFTAATGASASQEVFRIEGTGALKAPLLGTGTAPNNIGVDAVGNFIRRTKIAASARPQGGWPKDVLTLSLVSGTRYLVVYGASIHSPTLNGQFIRIMANGVQIASQDQHFNQANVHMHLGGSAVWTSTVTGSVVFRIETSGSSDVNDYGHVSVVEV